MPDDPNATIDAAVTAAEEHAREEGASEALWRKSLEDRMTTLESRGTADAPSVDLGPLNDAISGLGSRFDESLGSLTSRIDALEASRATHETAASAQAEVPETSQGEIAPQIDVQAASKGAVRRERAPRATHGLFRRLGRG